jgi:hypothetical protein
MAMRVFTPQRAKPVGVVAISLPAQKLAHYLEQSLLVILTIAGKSWDHPPGLTWLSAVRVRARLRAAFWLQNHAVYRH